MHAQSPSEGVLIPFNNPVELFPAGEGGAIDYGASYKAVCRQLMADGMGVLQTTAEAPERMVLGVHCEGRVFFLPGNRVTFRQVGATVYELQVGFTAAFDPQGPPPKIEFIEEEDVEPWLRDLQSRRHPAAEKRQHERSAYHQPIRVSGAPDEQPAFALNLSEGGIALITTFPLTAGVVRNLSLPQPDGTARQAKMRVVRCTPIIPPFHNVGGQFIK